MNSTIDFLASFGGGVLIRALWPEKQRPNQQPEPIRAVPGGWILGQKPVPGAAYTWYGQPKEFGRSDAWDFAERLNALGYGIYFAVNDTHGPHTKTDSVRQMRAIYQDDDDGWLGSLEVAGHLPHWTIRSSAGKTQSFWLTGPLLPEWQMIIHNLMVEFHGHDPSAGGILRLMRLPGFRNTKYEDAPLVKIVEDEHDRERISTETIEEYFGLHGVKRANANVHHSMNRIQSSGRGSPGRSSATVHKLERDPAKRGETNTNAEDAADAREMHQSNTPLVGRDKVLNVLARVFEPDCPYGEWVFAGGAIKGSFAHDPDLGFQLFDGISSLAPHRYNQGESLRLWNSLKAEKIGGAHWGSLERLARMTRVTTAIRKRRKSAMFKRFEKILPKRVPITKLELRYPRCIPSPDGGGYKPISHKENTAELLNHRGQELAFDTMYAQPVIRQRGLGPWKFIDRREYVRIRSHAQDSGYMLSEADLYAHVEMLAEDKEVNSVLDWLSSIKPWDGVERLPTLFQRHLGVKDTRLAREMGRLLLIAMVRRAQKPGIKYDYMLILEGAQGKGKSSIFKELIPHKEWFSESPRLDLEERRFFPLIAGKALVEFAEMKGKKSADIERIKAIVSQTEDEYIGNYARSKTRSSRIAVFVSTTNDKRYLRDMSGNRRFPILVPTKELDILALRAEREQLWAEALEYADFEDTLRLSPEAEEEAENVRKSRLDLEPGVEEFVDAIEALDNFDGGFITNETMWTALGIPYDERGRRAQGNAKHAMTQLKDRMRAMGWEDTEKPRKIRGKAQRGMFFEPVDDKPEEILHSSKHGLIYASDLERENEAMDE